MHVLALAADGFRNLNRVLLQPHPRFNVLFGDNGQGKTNLLEAIYLLATLRSFRTSHMGELLQFGVESCQVQARVLRQDIARLLQVELSGGRLCKKQALVDGKPARTADYFGAVNAVLFAPDDLRLPKGPPVARRRFLDRAVWNTCPAYLREAQIYERVLRNRNALLRGGAATPPPAELLEVYDQQLAAAGAVLLQRRVTYLQALRPRVLLAFERVTRTGLEAGLHYRAPLLRGLWDPGPDAAAQGPPDAAAVQAAHRAALQRDHRRDLQKGYTHSGPHADDLEFLLGGRAASLYASQGQNRALILALKIAEIEHLAETLGDAPVLLLDDVSSELDAVRNEHLFEFLSEVPCQTFITTTSPDHVRLGGRAAGLGDPVQAAERQDFRVVAGSIEPVNRAMVS